jgi:hypothetical protein
MSRFGIVIAIAVLCGCADTSADTDTAADTDTTTSDTDTTSTTDTGAQAFEGACVLGCEVPADCCPEGTIDCPGDYPNDWQCEAGSCALKGCQLADQCQSIGNFPDHECHPIAGFGSCFDPCESDADCSMIPGATCSGVADDDARYCLVDSPCLIDADCAGQGLCEVETGICGCDDDDDCSGPGLVCHVDP